MLYGHEARLPVDAALIPDPITPNKTVAEYLKDLKAKLAAVQKQGMLRGLQSKRRHRFHRPPLDCIPTLGVDDRV